MLASLLSLASPSCVCTQLETKGRDTYSVSLLVSFLAGDSGVEMAWGFLFLFCFLWNPALDKYTWTVGLWGLRHHAL